MTTFNFNVGDKVISLLDLSLWDNVYHYKNFEKSLISTVTSANERYFSISSFDVNLKKEFYGSDNLYVYEQKDGSCRDYSPRNNRLYHFDRDRDRIIAHLQTVFDKANKESDEADLSEIQKMEAQIRLLQNRIEAVKAGKRSSIREGVPQKEFLAERQMALLNLLAL